MTSNRPLPAEALIIASGSENSRALEIIRGVLKDFVHNELGAQEIHLGGRTIVAVNIALDPAHKVSIERDLNSVGESEGLDIAMELI